jgi:hypothetical protein
LRVLDEFEAQSVDEEPDRTVVVIDEQGHVLDVHRSSVVLQIQPRRRTYSGVRGQLDASALQRPCSLGVEGWLGAYGLWCGSRELRDGTSCLPPGLAAAVGERLPLICWYGATGNFMLEDTTPKRFVPYPRRSQERRGR